MSVSTLLGWMVCGLAVGFIARLLVPGWHRFGLLRTMVLGIAGSLVGGNSGGGVWLGRSPELSWR